MRRKRLPDGPGVRRARGVAVLPRRAGGRPKASPVRLIRRGAPWLVLVVLALVAATYSTYRISLSPPRLTPRAVVFSVATTDLFVDNPTSQLLYDGADPFQEAEDEIYNPKQVLELGQYLESQGPLQAMAKAAGIPGQVISASGPFTLTLGVTNTVATGPQIGNPPRTNPNYRLLVDFNGSTPMLTLYSQAPSLRAARAIVSEARAQVLGYVANQEAGHRLNESSRTVVRTFGPMSSGVVDPGANKQLFGLVFGLVLAFGGLLIWLVPRREAIRNRLPRPVPSSERDDDQDLWPHTRRPAPWFMAVFMGLLFLVPIDALLESTSTGAFTPTLDRILLIIAGVVWLITLLARRESDFGRPRVRFTRVHLAFLVFFGLCFVSFVVNAHELAINQEVKYGLKKLMVVAQYGFFFLLAASIIRPGEVKPFLKLMVWLGVACAIGTIIERGTRFNIFYNIWNGILPYTRPPEMDVLDDIGRLGVLGPTSEPLELATLLSLVLPFCIIFTLQAKERRDRILYLLAGAIVLSGAIATSRKTSIIAPATGLIVLIAYRPRTMLRAIAISIVPLFLFVHVAAPGQLGKVLTELEPAQASAVNTDKVRVERYDAVRPDIMTHLLFGRGYGTYDPIKYRYLDNEYLGLLLGVGVLGTLSFLIIFGSMLTMSHPLIRGPDRERGDLALGLQASLAMVIVTFALFDALSFQHVSYMMFYLGALIVALNKPRRTAVVTDGDGARAEFDEDVLHDDGDDEFEFVDSSSRAGADVVLV